MISIHVIADNSTQPQRDMAFEFLVELQRIFPNRQLIVNVAAGSQIDIGMQFVERVRAALPNIIIIWRILEDTGIYAVMSVENWFNDRVLPRLEWMRRMRVVMMIDNESSGDDSQMAYYATWVAGALRLLHAYGLNGAVLRFATGNIKEDQYALMKPVFDALQDGDWVSPNEYTNFPDAPEGSGGHLKRWEHLETAAGRKLPITIGEAGLLNHYAARDGWLGSTLTEARVVDILFDDEQWYRPEMVRCLFCIGGHSEWDRLQITQGILNLILKRYREQGAEMPDIEKKAVLTHTATVNVRSTPNGAVVGKLIGSDTHEVTIIGEPVFVAGSRYHWQKVRFTSSTLAGGIGYVAAEVVSFSELVVTSHDVLIDNLILDDAKSEVHEVMAELEVVKDKLELDLNDLQVKLNAVLIKLNTAH